MIDAIISTVLQIVVFAAVPFIFYWWENRRTGGFFQFIGLKPSTRKANLLGLLTGIIFLAGPITLAILSPTILAALTDPLTVTGKFHAMGLSTASILMLVLVAVFKTALAEEILFRGFIAKRLFRSFGFKTGNMSQALIFGLLHLLMLLGASAGLPFSLLIFFLSAAGAWISGYLNEQLAEGSIIPGWIAHATGNLISYTVIGFFV